MLLLPRMSVGRMAQFGPVMNSSPPATLHIGFRALLQRSRPAASVNVYSPSVPYVPSQWTCEVLPEAGGTTSFSDSQVTPEAAIASARAVAVWYVWEAEIPAGAVDVAVWDAELPQPPRANIAAAMTSVVPVDFKLNLQRRPPTE